MTSPSISRSIFERINSIYIRELDGTLSRTVGPGKQVVDRDWQQLRPQLCQNSFIDAFGPQKLDLALTGEGSATLTVYEVERQNEHGESKIIGVTLESSPEYEDEEPFQTFFLSLIFDKMFVHLDSPKSLADKPAQTKSANQVVDLFDSYLRYEGPFDQWAQGGRRYFEERVQHYTSRDAMIEFCLPAFPCKSSNGDKVTGVMPDRGEELALLRLHGFVKEIEAIYPPGAKVWIISDGHVFSDCIGVDDEVVDSYSARLIEMNNNITAHHTRERVGFRSLVDLFGLSNSSHDMSMLSEKLQLPALNHHLPTKMTDEAELSREILMAACESDQSTLRNKIANHDPSATALYRGFSRFMLEDLDRHVCTANMSRKQKKKVSEKVSFEMIQRNQAYSNLVELIFPEIVRLSIHAHTNSGPKYGVQLLDKSHSRAIRSLADLSYPAESSDLLHIPTPWHNSVVQIKGDNSIYVTKSKLVKDALADGSWTGKYTDGGFFLLDAKTKAMEVDATVTEIPLSPASESIDLSDTKYKRDDLVSLKKRRGWTAWLRNAVVWFLGHFSAPRYSAKDN